MKHLKRIIMKYRTLMLVYIFLGLSHAFLQSFGSRYFQKVIDSFTSSTLTVLSIIIYGSAMIALYIIDYLTEYPMCKLKQGIELSLKTNALKKMSVIDYLSYVKLGTGTLIQRIESGAAAGSNILFGFYLRLAGELIPSMLFSIAFIFIINRNVMLAILAGYIVVFAVTNLLLKVLYKLKANILVNKELFNHFIVRGFMEMIVFRVNRRFENEIMNAERAADEIIKSEVKMRMIHEAFFAAFAVIIGFMKIGILLYGWTTKTLTIGEVVALIALMDNAYTPVAIFNVCYVQYKLDMFAYARYSDFLDAKEDCFLTQGETVSKIKGELFFSKVCFKYNERKVLDNFNLHIQQGSTVAFVGESGSGKSTVVKLLCGLLHHDAGHITVDGTSLHRINLNSYYGRIAYLPQEPSVFDGTLRENLVFDDVTDNTMLMETIKKVGLDNLFSKLEKGFDTHLGERGISLSGGEHQQLALARLWFSKADIMILDEATSAIDNLTEEAVMKNVMALLSGKTVIAIAHRLDSIKEFDNIIVFQDGNIVEQGRFQKLIEKRQYFYDLYNRKV